MRTILNLFSTPVYTDVLEPTKFNIIQQQFQKTYETLLLKDRFKQNPNWNSSTHLLSIPEGTNFGNNLLEEFDHKPFIDELYRHCIIYLRQTNFPEKQLTDVVLTLQNSWMTLTKKGQHAHVHDHGNADISGVYWFKTNGNDGDIMFLSPNKSIKCSRAFTNYEQFHKFHPQNGRLMLFPGFLDHAVTENKTEEDRVSISFNIQIN